MGTTAGSSPAVSLPTPAASVLLARGPGSPEVFLVRRSPALRFFGGFWAFPGGKIDPADAHTPLHHDRPADADASRHDVRRVAAARELFEEAGVLLARRADGAFPAGGPAVAQLR